MFPLRTYARFARRYLQFRQGTRLPIQVTWYLADRCPIQCGGCHMFRTGSKSYLGARQVLDLPAKLAIARQLADIRLPCLAIAGGEPFQDPDLMGLVQAAGCAGITCSVTTNGVGVRADTILKFDGLLHEVWLSVYSEGNGPGETPVNEPCPRSMAAIKSLSGAMKRTHVGAYVVIDRHNIERVPGLLVELKKMGAARVGMRLNVLPHLKPDFEKVPETVKRLVKIKETYPRFLEATAGFLAQLGWLARPENAKLSCRLDLPFHLAILSDGRLSACPAYPVIMGDLNREHIRDVINRLSPALSGPIEDCPGCVRGDLSLYSLFLDKPWYRIPPRDLLKLFQS